jgi:hypothetical protein
MKLSILQNTKMIPKIRKTVIKVNNSLHIEDNIHYKRIRKLKPFNLSNNNSNDDFKPLKTYTIIKSVVETDSIYVFQDVEKSRSSIFLFENNEDAALFVTLLEAEIAGNGRKETSYIDVISNDIVELCKSNGFNCYFYPSGSLVTPMNMEV